MVVSPAFLNTTWIGNCGNFRVCSGVELSLSIDEVLKELFKKQNDKCFYFGTLEAV